ncbi:S41 family peptidase [Alishewanella sp. SMS8]|uniref:S41 family peptidase n=1 Tax=Alishewanella sp. SMS8 TaxID=2994676 RepID=UPI0027414D7C|nr:S41 family peptidase [Alishewanella sp. SMS8]MDP5458684.1 S41 family peptidase [Alishewanella sp. SMS8]
MDRKIIATAILMSCAALSLTACGGGGGGSSTPTSGGGSGSGGSGVTPPTWIAGQYPAESTLKNYCQTPRSGIDPFSNEAYPDRVGSSMHEKMWLRSWTNNSYLWYREVADRDPAPFSVANYFDLLRTEQLTDSGSPKDNFHFTEVTAEYQQQTQAGVTAGYGIKWSFGRNSPPRSITIAYTEPNSPARNAGLARGDQLVSINGVDFVNDNSEAGVDLLNRALFPSETGLTFNFVFTAVDGTRKTVSMTSANVSTSAVQNVAVLDTPTGKVGYMQFNTHIAPAQPQLISAVQQFASANVKDLVIDLRYNGGGLLALASQLGYMVTGPAIIQNQFFERTIFNDKYPNTNPITGASLAPIPFYSKVIDYEGNRLTNTDLPSLNLSRVFILSTGNTCSASEALINGLRGINVEVILVGNKTCGKPYGFYPTDNCGTTYFTIQFTGVNAQGFGEYADGFIPKNNPVFAADVKGCALNDDFSKPLGDPSERLFSAALYYAQNNSCPPLAVGQASATSNVQSTTGEASLNGGMPLLDPRYRDVILHNKVITELAPAEQQP